MSSLSFLTLNLNPQVTFHLKHFRNSQKDKKALRFQGSVVSTYLSGGGGYEILLIVGGGDRAGVMVIGHSQYISSSNILRSSGKKEIVIVIVIVFVIVIVLLRDRVLNFGRLAWLIFLRSFAEFW